MFVDSTSGKKYKLIDANLKNDLRENILIVNRKAIKRTGYQKPPTFREVTNKERFRVVCNCHGRNIIAQRIALDLVEDFIMNVHPDWWTEFYSYVSFATSDEVDENLLDNCSPIATAETAPICCPGE